MFQIVQCRDVGSGEVCNQIDESNRIKEAKGLQKMHFKSHLEMVKNHHLDYWDDVDIDMENFTLIAYDAERKVVYTYRVIIR